MDAACDVGNIALLGERYGRTIVVNQSLDTSMATEALDRIRNEIKALSTAERAELADELIKSLDITRDQGVEDAWEREIMRRVELIDSGQAKLLDRAAFRERMSGRIRSGT